MSQYNTLLKNIDKLENQVYSSGFDISKFFLNDQDAVKQLIKVKNPLMSDNDIDLMVDSEDDLMSKLEIEENKIAESEEQLASKDQSLTEDDKETQRIIRLKLREDRRRSKRETIQVAKKVYKDRLLSYYEESKDIKNEIRISSFLLVENSIDLSKKLINAVIQTSSTIPGVTIMMAAIPFNVPGAITLVITVVEAFMDIVTKMKEIVQLLPPLKKLEIVTDSKGLSVISSILNPILSILSSIWSPISALSKIVSSIISAIGSSMKKNRNRIFRKATRKLKKLGHLFKRNKRGDEYTVDGTKLYSYDEDDIDEVKDLLDTFKIARNKVVDYNQKIGDKTFEQTLDDLQSQLNSVEVPKKYPTSSDDVYSKYLYDVELPDGTILKNINDEGLESIKEKYKIEFTSLSI
jgi:hypothetical protein